MILKYRGTVHSVIQIKECSMSVSTDHRSCFITLIENPDYSAVSHYIEPEWGLQMTDNGIICHVDPKKLRKIQQLFVVNVLGQIIVKD